MRRRCCEETFVENDCEDIERKDLKKIGDVFSVVIVKLKRFKDIQDRVKKIKSKVRITWEKIPYRGVYDPNPTPPTIKINQDYKETQCAIGILLHELIHAVGGEESDAEFFENVCCSKGEGATVPDQSDFDEFWRVQKSKQVKKSKFVKILKLTKKCVKMSYGKLKPPEWCI